MKFPRSRYRLRELVSKGIFRSLKRRLIYLRYLCRIPRWINREREKLNEVNIITQIRRLFLIKVNCSMSKPVAWLYQLISPAANFSAFPSMCIKYYSILQKRYFNPKFPSVSAKTRRDIWYIQRLLGWIFQWVYMHAYFIITNYPEFSRHTKARRSRSPSKLLNSAENYGLN